MLPLKDVTPLIPLMFRLPLMPAYDGRADKPALMNVHKPRFVTLDVASLKIYRAAVAKMSKDCRHVAPIRRFLAPIRRLRKSAVAASGNA